MSIGLAIIARDEQENLPHLLESIEGAFDRVVLLDTGSTDDTMAVFVRWASCESERPGFTYQVGKFDWCDDFSAARIAADNLLLHGAATNVEIRTKPYVDWTSWADCDDEIIGAEHLKAIAENAPDEAAALVFGYDYAQHPETGACICHLRRERLVRAGRGVWSGRVHEAQNVDGPVQLVPDNIAHWKHRKSLDDHAGRSNERNLKILRAWVEDEPENPRVNAYMGKEIAASGEHEDAVGYYMTYLSLNPDWTEEKAQIYRLMAASMWALEAPIDAIEETAWEGVRHMPTWPDSWITLAECYAKREDHQNALWAIQRVIELGMPDTMLIVNPLDYLSYPHRLAAAVLGAMGNLDEAIAAAERSLELNPGDQMLRELWIMWRGQSKRQHTADTYVMCAEQLVAHDEQVKAKILIESCVPHFAYDHPKVVAMRTFVRDRLRWVDEGFLDHYEHGGSKPEDFHTDEQAEAVAQMLPRVGYLMAGLQEQGAELVPASETMERLA